MDIIIGHLPTPNETFDYGHLTDMLLGLTTFQDHLNFQLYPFVQLRINIENYSLPTIKMNLNEENFENLYCPCDILASFHA